MAPVRIPHNFFGPPTNRSGKGWDRDPSFIVVSTNEAAAAEALQAAADRFLCVNHEGRELEAWELPGASTPNNVSELTKSRGGLLLTADTKGQLSEAMGQRMVEILREELENRDVDCAVVRPMSPDQIVQRTGEREWVVARSVAAMTVDEVPYLEWQYWTGESWTMDRSKAQVWHTPPNELVEKLISAPAQEGVGQPMSVHLPVGKETWPMPPTSKRAPKDSRGWPA